MKHTKLLPVWALVLIDIVLIGAVLCSFAYFHHIRFLWGIVKNELEDGPVFTKSNGDSDALDTPILSEGDYDYSGDFAATLPEVFLRVGEEVVSDASTYQSRDISIKLTRVDTELYYNNKIYDVQYFVYDIYVRNIENLYTVAVSDRESLEDLLDRSASMNDAEGNVLTEECAVAAVNGDYWGNANHTQLAIRNGKLLRESDFISSDICILYFDGTMETVHPEDFNWQEIAAKNPYQIWEFGPALLDENGKALSKFSSESYDNNIIDSRHPRCAIGYYEPGHYCLVVVDGRSDDSDGVRMFQLANIFEELGCKAAYNFDGGDSCQAYFNGEMVREAEDRGSSQRKLFDIVCIGEVAK